MPRLLANGSAAAIHSLSGYQAITLRPGVSVALLKRKAILRMGYYYI